MVPPPDIAAFAALLEPIDTKGPERYIYSYNHERDGNLVNMFLDELERKAHARFTHYIAAFRMVAQQGWARNDKWRPLDPQRPPRGIITDISGNRISLDGMGEFKNIAHKSRIFHCMEPGGLFVLLTPYTSKKEDDLKAEAVNPALRAREEYMRRKMQLIATKGRTK